MTRPFFLDGLMKAQEETLSVDERYQKFLKERTHECWSCGSHEPDSRIAEKVLVQDGERTAEMICFECLETGAWLR